MQRTEGQTDTFPEDIGIRLEGKSSGTKWNAQPICTGSMVWGVLWDRKPGLQDLGVGCAACTSFQNLPLSNAISFCNSPFYNQTLVFDAFASFLKSCIWVHIEDEIFIPSWKNHPSLLFSWYCFALNWLTSTFKITVFPVFSHGYRIFRDSHAFSGLTSHQLKWAVFVFYEQHPQAMRCASFRYRTGSLISSAYYTADAQ